MEDKPLNVQISKVVGEIKKNIKGKDDIIFEVLLAVLAGGHILLEDIPGVGKTTLALSLSKAMSLEYKRVQFTPDVLPSDITGFTMYNQKSMQFEFHPGAAMCNLMLADEINRTSPKTQSALLEIMEEGRVTVDGVTYDVPSPFVVIATQNPFGSAGTQRLPESQMDRFMIRLSMGYPDHAAALQILREDAGEPNLQAVLNLDELSYMQQAVQAVYVDESIYEFIINFTEATRKSESIELGLSPRGSKALLRIAKASAFADSRNFVSVADIMKQIPPVVGHRIVLNSKAKARDVSVEQVLKNILNEVRVPKI
ncbi:MAG: MoxR family ATPase [Lachnospiraceae bacterium]|nr:MoxR family ATPase [Lachnospiraceae bacterium]